ncbi:MAG: trypsin-like peptidase domain-containing protein [Clostridia bacterium]|nr:trypsin-like peptidase domain-containing protein [Clostridia bacterium]
MNDREDIFGTDVPEENTQPAEPQVLEPEAEDAQSIAEKYIGEPIVEAQPVEEKPQTPPAYGAYVPPQQTYQQWQPQYSYQPQGNGEEPQKKKKKGRKVFCIILALALIISAVAIPVSLLRDNEPEGGYQGGEPGQSNVIDENAPQLEIEKTPADTGKNNGSMLSAEEIYEKIADINVAVMIYKSDSLYTEGTGIVMGQDKTGKYTYIITCAHVISDPGIEAVIQLEDGTRYDAVIAGYDARTDIGVLKIEAKGLKAAEFGDSDSLKVGSTVYAIGNPGGSALFGTFTDGKVSAIGRNITSSIGYDMVCIQHNAAISPGNSGGALVNEYGQVIGINSAKIAATEYEGISFAIPITQAKEIIDKVIAYGYVPGRPKLGISYVANDSSAISGIYSMAVQMMDLPSGSLVIYSIDKNSALAGTEAQPGDMIISVNGKDLDKADVLLEMIEDSSVGDVLTLELFRITTSGGRYHTEELTVKAKLVEENNTKVEETTTAGVYGNDDYGFGGYDFGFDFGF